MATALEHQPDLFVPAAVPVTTPAPNPVAREKARLNAAALRVLARLKQGPALNHELCSPAIGGLRSAGRCWELEQDGYEIKKTHVERGTWRYELIGYKGESGAVFCGNGGENVLK